MITRGEARFLQLLKAAANRKVYGRLKADPFKS